MYAIAFDLVVVDTVAAHPKGVAQAYADIRSVLASHGFDWRQGSLHMKAEHNERVNDLKKFENEIKMTGVQYPVKVDDIKKVEKLNDMTINVYEEENKKIYPIRTSETIHATRHVNLLLITDEKSTNRHYVLIKSFSGLVSTNLSKHKGKAYYCYKCTHGFTSEKLLLKHTQDIGCHAEARETLPKAEDAHLEFKDYKKGLKLHYAIYADFECVLINVDDEITDEKTEKNIEKKTKKYQQHTACSYSYIVVCNDPKKNNPVVLRRAKAKGETINHFLRQLLKEEEEILKIYHTNKPMIISDEQEEEFQKAVCCHICKKELKTDRDKDHDHFTGLYRGAAHKGCNVNYNYKKLKYKIPVYFHNLQGYDEHLILNEMAQIAPNIRCIAKNTEKFMTFQIGHLHFNDSYSFMGSSLDELVESQFPKGCNRVEIIKTKFKITYRNLKQYTDEQLYILVRKGLYPYDYMDSFEKFNETSLPPKEKFYSKLNKRHITDEEYELACQVWKTFKCKTMGDYHDLYLKLDVLLLADVFENFRTMCLEYYSLDPSNYISAPQFSWDAALRMTGVKLQLFDEDNIDMYNFVESGIRGGISMISNRYAKANNPLVSGYDSSLPNEYIIYLDANNLYGWAMSQYLPVDGYAWQDEKRLKNWTPEKILALKDDQAEGYVFQVDLKYPVGLHDLHNDYPLAPESLQVSEDMMSEYMKSQQKKHEIKPSKVSKLIPNLNNKTKYIIHYRNLKQCLQLGLEVTKIHRVLKFRQTNWLEKYISFNTSKRAVVKSTFEKNFFKLMNNSVFGKTMENVRNRVDVRIATTESKHDKLALEIRYLYKKQISEDVAIVNMEKKEVILNKPICVGFCILDLSKVLMYDFHYNKIKAKYQNNAKLLFTDTDSLCYSIKTPNLYADMKENADLYDFSDYPEGHPLKDNRNKKVIGKMKDETEGVPIKEFVGLRSKMYSCLLAYEQANEHAKKKENVLSDEYAKKTAKGIKKSVEMIHDDYKRCLFGESLSDQRQVVNMNLIRSINQQLYTVSVNKVGLSNLDDKSYYVSALESYRYGHYKTKNN